MSEAYLREKLTASLTTTNFDRHDAQTLLITWAMRDPQLLLAMTKPHLKAIANGWIEYHTRNVSLSSSDPASPSSQTSFANRTAIDDLVAAAAVHLPIEPSKKSNIPPPKSTEHQAMTMRKLAAAFRKKKT